MSGLDALHLLEMVVRPTLRAMGPDYSTVAAEQLVMGTAAKESGGFVALRQYGHGPALGLWQCEPSTFRDLVNRCPAWMLREIANIDTASALIEPTTVVWNLKLGTMMCRMKYRDAEPDLPRVGDVPAMAVYWKVYYNSALGKGNPDEFERSWSDYIAPRYKEMWT